MIVMRTREGGKREGTEERSDTDIGVDLEEEDVPQQGLGLGDGQVLLALLDILHLERHCHLTLN